MNQGRKNEIGAPQGGVFEEGTSASTKGRTWIEDLLGKAWKPVAKAKQPLFGRMSANNG